tara:strand:- start:458 stop:733 length:276 start_codon:yes stop_codon:yes gene_type:complete
VSSFEIDIFVLFKSVRSFDLLNEISSLSKSSAKFGKLSIGKHNKLKSELSVIKFNLFSFFKSNLISELPDIFLRMSYKTVADVVVAPSLLI